MDRWGITYDCHECGKTLSASETQGCPGCQEVYCRECYESHKNECENLSAYEC